jgi:DnaJ family protein C protein 8
MFILDRDSVLTPKQQIDRLTRPGATYFNLNPFEVLQVDRDTPLNEIKQKFRRMSILVHPDKNLDDNERAQKAFDAVNKAWKTLDNPEGYKQCVEVIEEAQKKADEIIAEKRKKLKKELKASNQGLSLSSNELPPIDPEELKHTIHVQTCKMFADLERLRREHDMKDMHERKRKAEEESEEHERKKLEQEWNKNFEESRSDRVNSWRSWKTSSGKNVKGTFRPPKLKPEQRLEKNKQQPKPE